jgi:hypothetical protein
MPNIFFYFYLHAPPPGYYLITMAKSFQFAAVVAVLLALCGNALGGKTCFFVDGDCKPNPSGLPAGAKGDAA